MLVEGGRLVCLSSHRWMCLLRDHSDGKMAVPPQAMKY